jgi:hypothetical protein
VPVVTRPGQRWRRDEPNEPADVDCEPDDNMTRQDLEREADRAADRYERALWGDR